MNRLAVLAAALLLALAGVARPAAPPAPSAEPVALVRQLGAAAFADREAAARGLLRLGRSAAAALRAGLRSPDLEVRRRCAALLPAVLRTDEDRRLDAFLRDGPAKGGPPLPGWASLKEVAGGDVTARLLYAELYRDDRPLLDLLDKGPRQAGGQLGTRLQQVQQRLYRGNLAEPAGAGLRQGELAGLLAAFCCARSVDQSAYYRVSSIFYQPYVRGLVHKDLGLRRLASRALAKHGLGPNVVTQTAYLAKSLQLQELLDALRPVALRQVQAALTQPPDLNKLLEAVHLANALDLLDAVAPRVQPVARQLAATVLSRPDDQGRTYQVLNLLQTLQMQETIDTVLKPAVVKLAEDVAERPEDRARFYRALSLARSLNAPEALAPLQVAGRKLALAAAANPSDAGKLNQALAMTQTLGLTEAREGLLKPAVRKQVLSILERTDDLQQLTQAARLCESVGLTDLPRDTLQPVARRRAAALLKGPASIAQLQQAHQLAQQLRLADVTEDAVKPALRKLLLAAQDRPVRASELSQALSLARSLRLKEGVGLAAKAAQQRGLEGHARAQAVLFVASFGDREQVARLEAVLADTTNLGQIGFDGSRCTAQLGDVALGALVHASGQSLGDSGFLYFQAVPGLLPLEAPPVCFGFPDAKARAAAVAKWQKWSAAQKKKAP
jgi:hypothetical protein